MGDRSVDGPSKGSTDNANRGNNELLKLKNSLRIYWTEKKGNNLVKLHAELTEIFSNYVDPLDDFLTFFSVIYDAGWSGSFSYHVTREFITWLKGNNKDKNISPALVQRALLVTSKSASKDIKSLIFTLYELSEYSNLLLELVPQFKQKHWYSQLSQWVSLFGLEESFTPSDFLKPMLLMGDYLDILLYLSTRPQDVLPIVEYADSVICSNRDMTQQYHEYQIPLPNKHVLSNVSRNIELFMKKSIKQFNISSQATPNFNSKMIENEIRLYVVSLNKNEMSEDALKERVLPLCRDNEYLQKKLIAMLFRQKQTEYLVAYFCKEFNLDMEIPKGIPRCDVEEDYHTVESLKEMTVFVDNDEGCQSLFLHIDSALEGKGSSDNVIVGLDTEWKSTSSFLGLSPPPALLQIAFPQKVFILDVIKLEANLDFWKQLSEKFFDNQKFVKLGYGLDTDSSVFNASPTLSFIHLKGGNFLDLLKEERKYHKSIPVKFPFQIEEPTVGPRHGPKAVKGLSRLVQLCLGKPVDKREKFSDWELRPLRPQQLIYAAMDAYCLLEVYNVLKEMHQKANFRFNTNLTNNRSKNKVEEKKRTWQKRWYGRRNVPHVRKRSSIAIQATIESNDATTQTNEE